MFSQERQTPRVRPPPSTHDEAATCPRPHLATPPAVLHARHVAHPPSHSLAQGLFYSGPDIASIFQPLIPVFTALLAFLLCMEKLPGAGRHYQWFKLLGIALGAGGAILMTVVRSSSSASEVRRGGAPASRSKSALLPRLDAFLFLPRST